MGDEPGSRASKHQITKVLECHAQIASDVQASEEISSASGTDNRKQQNNKISLDLRKPPPVLGSYYTSITRGRSIKKIRVSRSPVVQAVCGW